MRVRWLARGNTGTRPGCSETYPWPLGGRCLGATLARCSHARFAQVKPTAGRRISVDALIRWPDTSRYLVLLRRWKGGAGAKSGVTPLRDLLSGSSLKESVDPIRHPIVRGKMQGVQMKVNKLWQAGEWQCIGRDKLTFWR